MPRLPILAALLLIAPLASSQDVYKWKDAKGTVHYSETAPPQGTHFQRMTLGGTVETAQEPKGPQEQVPTETTQPPAPRRTAAQMADTPANRATLCVTLKSNLATLQGSGPVVMQQDGKPSLLGDIQRKQQIANAQAQYKQYCK